METLIKIKPYGSFTEENLETHKILSQTLRICHPHLYPEKAGDSKDMPSLVYKDTILMDASVIQRNVLHGHEQPNRAEGINPRYPEMRVDILNKGWQLQHFPICVREVNGKFYFTDGRTKDIILQEANYKNRIVNIYTCNDADALIFGFNSNFTSTISDNTKEISIVAGGIYAINNNMCEHDKDAILEWVYRSTSASNWKPKTKENVRNRIYHAIQVKGKLLPRAWKNDSEVKSWLTTHDYKDTAKIVYLPYASSSPKKAIVAAAKLSRLNPDKEIRIVPYLSKLDSEDLQLSYINSMIKFREEYYTIISEILDANCVDYEMTTSKIKVYGAAPSNLEGICDNMGKGGVAIFGKTDQKISLSYLDALRLGKKLDIDDHLDLAA